MAAAAPISASKGNVTTQKEKGSKGSKKRSLVDDKEHQTKRAKCPGVRLIGSRIYDSENGNTCHQCRQKTRDFVASCKNGNKPCTIKFCHKCLLNRYGEKAEEVVLLDEWNCPRCRGICNCSFCMKKKGCKPTGILVHSAKSTGYSSVSEMLLVNGTDNIGHHKNDKKADISPNKEAVMISPRKRGKENSLDGSGEIKYYSQNSSSSSDAKVSKKTKRDGLKELCSGNEVQIKQSKKSSPTKTKLSEDICEKGVEANGKGDGVGAPSGKKYHEALVQMDSSPKHSLAKDTKVKNEARLKYGKVANAIKDHNARSLKDVSSILTKAEDTDDRKDCKTQKDAEPSNARKKNKDINDTVVDSYKIKECDVNIQSNQYGADIPLPQGANLTSVAGIELAIEDVGHALQFLEFCAVFGKVLNLKKGHAESVLRDLMRERRRCRMQDCLTVRFHVQLLSLILKDMGEESPSLYPMNGKNLWLQALQKCMADSSCVLDELPPDYFDKGGNSYDKLDFSRRLRLLNFLCDEALGTTELRCWIEDQNSNFVKTRKEAKEMIVAVKDEEKRLKQKLQDELAKALTVKNGVLSIAEHEAIVSKIRNDVAQVHSERLVATGMVPKSRQRPDAIRIEPILLDVDGRAFWKLKNFNAKECIFLQDMGTWEAVAPHEKWSLYEADQKEDIMRYISSLSVRRLKTKNIAQIQPTKIPEANI